MRITSSIFALLALVVTAHAHEGSLRAKSTSLARVKGYGETSEYQSFCADIGIPTGAGDLTVDLLASVETKNVIVPGKPAPTKSLTFTGALGISGGVGIGRLGATATGDFSISSDDAPGHRAMLAGTASALKAMFMKTNPAHSAAVEKAQDDLLTSTLTAMGLLAKGTSVNEGVMTQAIPALRLAVEVARAGMAKASSDLTAATGAKLFCWDGNAKCKKTDGTNGVKTTTPEGVYQYLAMQITDMTIQKMFGGKSMAGGHKDFSCNLMPATFPVDLASVEAYLDPAVAAQVKTTFASKLTAIPVPGQLLCHMVGNDPYTPFMDTSVSAKNKAEDADGTSKYPTTFPTVSEEEDPMTHSIQKMMWTTFVKRDAKAPWCKLADVSLEKGLFARLATAVGAQRPCRFTVPMAVANMWPSFFKAIGNGYLSLEMEATSGATPAKQWADVESAMLSFLHPADGQVTSAANAEAYKAAADKAVWINRFDWTVREMRGLPINGISEMTSAQKLHKFAAKSRTANTNDAKYHFTPATAAPALPRCVDFFVAPVPGARRPFLSFPASGAACGTAFSGPSFAGNGASSAITELVDKAKVTDATKKFTLKLAIAAAFEVSLATKMPSDKSTACTESPQSAFKTRFVVERDVEIQRGPYGMMVTFIGEANVWKQEVAGVVNIQPVPIFMAAKWGAVIPKNPADLPTDSEMSLEATFIVSEEALEAMSPSDTVTTGAGAAAIGAAGVSAAAKSTKVQAAGRAAVGAAKAAANAATTTAASAASAVMSPAQISAAADARLKAHAYAMKLIASAAARMQYVAQKALSGFAAVDAAVSAGSSKAKSVLQLMNLAHPSEQCPTASTTPVTAPSGRDATAKGSSLQALATSTLGAIQKAGGANLVNSMYKPDPKAVGKAILKAALPAGVEIGKTSLEVTLSFGIKEASLDKFVIANTGVNVNLYETSSLSIGVGAASAAIAYKEGNTFDVLSLADTLARVTGLSPSEADPCAATPSAAPTAPATSGLRAN